MMSVSPANVHVRVGKIRKKLKMTSSMHITTPIKLGMCMFPLQRNMALPRKPSCRAGRNSAKILKYKVAPWQMETSPPSQCGRLPLIAIPMTANRLLKVRVDVMDCLNTSRASFISPAPILWATCTEKPVAAEVHIPQKSHVVVDTRPIDAEASAPRLPTIDASIYCMMTVSYTHLTLPTT